MQLKRALAVININVQLLDHFCNHYTHNLFSYKTVLKNNELPNKPNFSYPNVFILN